MRYLNSFKPLCCNKHGRLAIKKHGLLPFIDASCRLEPDFQSPFPSISALCRANMFAPRLQEGDSVIYITVKGRYEPAQYPHWRLIAILRVVRRFDSHKQAAVWYQDAGLTLPSNCIVEGNNCLPYDMTMGVSPPDRLGNVTDTDELLRRWDSSYKWRARRFGAFLACEAEFLELNQPPIITDKTMRHIFDRIPPTRTPPAISESEYAELCKLALSSKRAA